MWLQDIESVKSLDLNDAGIYTHTHTNAPLYERFGFDAEDMDEDSCRDSIKRSNSVMQRLTAPLL